MFRIYADNVLIYDSSLDDYVITKGQIEREVSKSGKFTFTLYSDHPHFDRIEELKTIIKVYRDDSLVFRGRVLSYVDGFNADRTFTCEGELSFFVDSVQRPYVFQGSPADLFRQFVTAHNLQVEEAKRFTVGEVTVKDPNDYIRRENGSYENTLTNIQDRLTGSLGGYITFTEGPGGTRVINWLAEYGSLSSQSIQFGENLLDYARTRSAESIATVLIPLGAQSEETGERITVASVNDGKDFIVDETAAARYGLISAVEIWDDVTVPANLLTKGRTRLSELSSLITSIELTAIDLSDLDRDIDAFALGDYVRVISPPHGLNAVYMLTKQTVDILAPENNRITLGHTFAGFTDRTVDASQLSSRLDTLSVTKASKGSVEAVQSEITGISGQISAIEGGSWTGLTLSSDWTASKPVQYRTANRQVFITGAISPVLAYGASATEVEFASGILEALRPAAKVKVLQSGEDLFTFLITIRSDGTLAISKYSDPSGYGAMSPMTTYEFNLSYSI